MTSTYLVESYHINIGLGDSAIHVLIKVTGTTRDAVKLVWIDGGKGGVATMKKFWATVTFIKARFENLQKDEFKFDTIVVTHWDDDHHGGFVKWIEKSPSKASEYFRFPDPMTRVIFPAEDEKLPDIYQPGKYLELNKKQVATLHSGKSVLGQNFFADDWIAGSLYPQTSLATLFASNGPPVGQPAMYCVAIDLAVISGAALEDSTAVWPDDITRTNQASVAAIIAWHPSNRISHYFAGDLDASRESLIVKWLAKTLNNKRVLSVKASHHGSASSNPPELFTTLRPRNIIVSAANSHNHPDWEFLALISSYGKKQTVAAEDSFHQPPLIFTCYPYWIDRIKAAGNTVLPVQYFDNSTPLKGNRAKLVAAAKKILTDMDSPMFDELKAFVTVAGTAIDTQALYSALQKVTREAGVNLFADIANYKAYTKKNGVQFILATSSDEDGTDGAIDIKADAGVLKTITRTMRVGWKKAVVDTPKKLLGISVNSKLIKKTTLAVRHAVVITKRRVTRSMLRSDSSYKLADPSVAFMAQPDPSIHTELATTFESLSVSAVRAQPDTESVDEVAVGVESLTMSNASTTPVKAPDYAFSIIGSEVDPGPGVSINKQQRLSATDPFDDFVLDLRSGAIRLSAAPTTTHVSLDQNDGISQWMGWSCNSKDVSLSIPSATSISMKITLHNGLVFDTDYAAAALGPDTSKPDILSPGLPPGFGNSFMVLGLSSESAPLPDTTPLLWSISDVIEFLDGFNSDAITSGGGTIRHPLVNTLLDGVQWSLKKDMSSLAGKRNAIWFAPGTNYMTTLRLAFELSDNTSSGVLSFLKSFWPDSVSLTIRDCQLICSRQVVLAETFSDSTTLLKSSKLSLCATVMAQIQGNSGPVVELQIATELSSNGTIELTVQSNAENEFISFAEAVVKRLSGSTRDISFSAAIPSAITKSFHFRELILVVDASKSLTSAKITVEVDCHLGSRNDNTNIALLLQGIYSKGDKDSGLSFYGGLWFPVENDDNSADRYFPDWESWHTLSPVTQNIANSFALTSLLPDRIDVTNLPKNIPQIVTEAGFEVSPNGVEISAVIQSCTTYIHNNDTSLPTLSFDEVALDASYDWTNKQAIVDLEFRISLQGPPDYNVPRPTCSNQLVGTFHYDSGDGTAANKGDKSWSMSASIQYLKLGALYTFFTDDSRDLLYDILKEIDIRNLVISYSSTSSENLFKASGSLILAEVVAVSLTYQRSSTGIWSFAASIKPEDKIIQSVTLADIASSLFGGRDALTTGLPDFIANAEILGPNAGGASMTFKVHKYGTDGVQLMLSAQIGHVHALFVQLHDKTRTQPIGPTNTVAGPIRFFRLSLGGLAVPRDIPVLSDFRAPFDELGVSWVNSDLTAEDVAAIKAIQNDSTSNSSNASSKSTEQPMINGFHFTLLSAGSVVIDYPIGKARAQPRPIKGTSVAGDSGAEDGNNNSGVANKDSQNPPLDSQSPKTPLKKSQGPLTINDIQIHYKDNVISVQLDAVFVIGPLTFALFGFEIGLNMQGGLDITKFDIKNVSVDLDGLAASFNKPPLTLEGGLIHKKDHGEDIYAGGITIGFTPWLFQAAGFYGKALNPNTNKNFTTAFVYAMLRGPLITLEFATISGITGAFGYNVDVRIPKIEEVYKFPLLNPASDTKTIYDTLKELMGPVDGSLAWFTPKEDSMWLAAGLTISAFEMLSVTAVLIVQWSPQLQFHVLGLGTADIPNPASPVKFAHIELGFLAVVDVPNGLFRVEAQLSPNSYILDRSCHLSGGFAMFYWFKTTSAATAGDFVFTIGGYHSAFEIPANYPRPPRLAINWSYSDNIAIKGEAYFAITPKACMGGMHISATLTAGPIKAWFDAYADFLINYAPFRFQATGGISVGVAFDGDVLFIHVHIQVEIGATLYLFGPPVAGTVHVDFWIKSFNIDFGDHSNSGNDRLSLDAFHDLVLETKTPGKKTDHVYVCLGGLHARDSKEQKDTDPWLVRGGPFAFGINSYMAFSTASVNGEKISPAPLTDTIYARPTRSTSALTSDVSISITIAEPAGPSVRKGWRCALFTKSVPRALWGQYSEAEDPTAGNGGNNSIDTLLNSSSGTSTLMMGIELHAPKTYKSDDLLAPFDINRALTQDVSNPNKPPNYPTQIDQSKEWTPAASMPTPVDPDPTPRKKGQAPRDQWELVQDAWQAADATTIVAAWAGAMGWKSAPLAQKPQYLIDNFGSLYLEAPHTCGVAA